MRSRTEGGWQGVDRAQGVLGAAGGVCGREVRGTSRSDASALDGAQGQVMLASGAFVQVAVLAGGGGAVVGSGGVARVIAVGSGREGGSPQPCLLS